MVTSFRFVAIFEPMVLLIVRGGCAPICDPLQNSEVYNVNTDVKAEKPKAFSLLKESHAVSRI